MIVSRRLGTLKCSVVQHIHKQQQRFKTTSFKILDGRFNANAVRHQNAVAKNDAALSVYRRLQEQVKRGGGSKSIHRHTVVNKKLVISDKLDLLLDEDSDKFEIGRFAGFGMDYGDISCGGQLSAIGKVNGQYCSIFGNDGTIKGGTMYPIGVKKFLRSQEIALKNHLPCIYIVDSGGAFLPLQSEIFADKMHGGRSFHNEAVMQAGNIPQISVVCGSCTAGGAYIPNMCHEVIMVNGISYVYLGGPPLVKAATGEEISDDALGGAELHCRVSGCSDHLAESESEAFEVCRGIVETLNLPKVDFPQTFDEPVHSDLELSHFAGLTDISKDDIYKILSRILDSSQFQEFKSTYGCNLISGFGYIAGMLVGVVANHGRLTAEDGLKGAHFVSMCEYRNIPLIFLQYSSPCSPVSNIDVLNDGIAINNRGKMMSAVACTTVPRIAVNIGGCFGDDNYTMSGESFSPHFLLSWPTALTSQSEITEEQVANESDFSKVESNSDFSPASAFHCAFNISTDALILPQETRKVLIRCLKIVRQGQIFRHSSNRHTQPIFRM